MNKDLTIDMLSKLTIFSKYAKYIPELQRRETWEEICNRVEEMHRINTSAKKKLIIF
jgi:ribonucleoside-diphosphate reductase alpha chain